MEYIFRFSTAIGRYWKRLLVGAVLAWVAVNAFLIALLVVMESQHFHYEYYDFAQLAQALLLFSFPAGALLAYGRRPREVSQ